MYTQSTLGIAPVIAAEAIAIGEKELKSLFAGHSTLYKNTQAAIPLLKQQALSGNVCAYVVLKSLSGDQTFCRMAIDQCHQIGTQVGQPGPCGAADDTTKAMARAAWQEVDASPSAYAVANQAAGQAANQTASIVPGLVGSSSLMPLVLIAGVAFLVMRGK